MSHKDKTPSEDLVDALKEVLQRINEHDLDYAVGVLLKALHSASRDGVTLTGEHMRLTETITDRVRALWPNTDFGLHGE